VNKRKDEAELKKDAYYFPHFSNARGDRKLKRVVKELGVEGYGIYFMLLEVLRDQSDFTFPMEDIDLLADEFNTSEQKVKIVICNYELFTVDDYMFFSIKFNEFMQPYLSMKEQRRKAGIKSGEIRALMAKTPEEEKRDSPQVYIIRCFNEKEEFIKIGATKGTISKRYSGHLPYDYEVLRQIFTNEQHALEKELHGLFFDYKLKPNIKFSGDAECYNVCILTEVVNYNPDVRFSHERVFKQCLNENEQSKVKESKVKEKKQTSSFVLPLLTEVKAYCKERNNNIDSETFIDFYSSKGWMIGKNKMKDWKAAVRTWEKSSTNSSGRSPKLKIGTLSEDTTYEGY